MLGFFRGKPTCPVHPVAKTWLESRLGWLIKEFGHAVFLERDVILPNHQFLPENFDYSDSSLRKLLNKVCTLMEVDPRDIDLDVVRTSGNGLFLTDTNGRAVSAQFGGLYQSIVPRRKGTRSYSRISINVDELLDLRGLIGTLAHELAHERLLGEGRIDAEAFDHELTTDLTAIFFGFGLFVADGSRVWPGAFDVWPGTQLKRPEYMTPPLSGYAMAHRAWLTGESKPAWASQLAYDVRACFHQGLRFLNERGDSLLADFRRGYR